MKFKKILCGVTAALMLGSLLAVTASADDKTAAVKKLLSVNLSDIDGADDFFNFGNEIYGYNNAGDPNVENDVDGIIRIDLEKWRETGKFAYSDVETDFDMTDVVPSFSAGYGFRGEGRYMQFRYPEKAFVVKLDKDNNKMTTAYSIEEVSMKRSTLPDGHTFAAEYGKTSLRYAVYDSSGNKTENTIVFAENEEDTWWSSWSVCTDFVTGKYIAYILSVEKNYTDQWLKVYGVKKDGVHELVYSQDYQIINEAELRAGSNFASWTVDLPVVRYMSYVYSAEDGKLYNFDKDYSVNGMGFAGLEGKLYGTKAVGYFNKEENKGNVEDGAYALVDLTDTSKPISKAYKSMGTFDGEIYLVEDFNGKWGYIDSNGKELAFFDDASEFIGDYAPVVSNGKGYLIDRSMKQISDTVSAKECRTADDGLYYFYTDRDTLLVTYSNETVSAPEISEPAISTGGYVEPASGAPSTSASEPVADSNPSTGIALSFFPIAAALSAVIVIKKKK